MKNKNKLIRLTAGLLMVATLATFGMTALFGELFGENSPIRLFKGNLDTGRDQYFDGNVVMKLPEGVKDSDEISVIVRVMDTSLLDAYGKETGKQSFAEFADTEEALEMKREILSKKDGLVADLQKTDIDYRLGKNYTTVLSGFEVILKAGDFEGLCKVLGDRADVIVGEEYKQEENKLVDNHVNVYDTGIFDSSDFGYDGTGTVVAVLDTGLDYLHSAFSTTNFTADRSKLGLTFSQVEAVLSKTRANGMQSGLTASDVYISDKVPFGFDYADGDSDVFPLSIEHGTHVAGVIAGKDQTITGVAPNAQLVIMKTFSDAIDTARSSWILAALEDCVYLGVDVINMSLGTSCGFSRENDLEAINGVYDKIRETGISLVVAASNSHNSTYGSEKNGNLGLTSNPDSATVGSPGTYKGALSVASVNGAKTPYILYNDRIIYFTETANRILEDNHFVDDFFKDGSTGREVEFVTVPGAGRSADYMGIDVKGKVVLLRRGSNTFEEKANVAQEKGAAGVIIYNNVSGEIKMNVGDAKIPVCSIRQDDGEFLASLKTGKLKLDRSQVSGPFMSDFSSWGPTPDLGIKPEITAHGGSILSAIPGQKYDRISGTSMACPNMSGVCALLRQFVRQNYPDVAKNSVEVTDFVNRLLMSTADIVFNTNGLPTAVRKQGAGLANLAKAGKTTACILAYNRADGSLLDKSKIELGDDPAKTGVYNLKFSIQNFGKTTLSYTVSAHVMTEGVSETKTSDGKTTVDELGYILDGASVEITSIANGSKNGAVVTVEAGKTCDVTLTVTLSDKDKNYLDTSFANGMYVEGFVILDNTDANGVDLNVPYLAFYGDWNKAPIFDLDYFATNKDELDDSIDREDKTLPDVYATRPVGGVSEDFVNYLGAYYFEQNPADKLIAASRDYISLSNQEGSVHTLRFVWAGLLRCVSRLEITVTDQSTGEVIFEKTENDVRKSCGDGQTIRPANVKVDFDTMEQKLKNNTKYTVKLKAYTDYGDGGDGTNLNNEFEFPLVADFEAPTVTDCNFYTEYDKSQKKTRYFAKLAVYDNHYAMALHFGYVGDTAEGYQFHTFSDYLTPVYSTYNSTTYVTFELTDYLDLIKNQTVNKNRFTVACYDYALNQATYEIALPDEFQDFYFEEEENGLTLSPNEIYALKPTVYPSAEWSDLLEYQSSNPKVARIVNNKIIAIGKGKSTIRAKDRRTNRSVYFTLTVLGEGDEGYVRYDKPVTDNFYLVGYHTNKAYFILNTIDRKIGATGDNKKFESEDYSLTMYPSESVTLQYAIDMFFPDDTEIVFESGNDDIVRVNEYGVVTAVSEGLSSVTVRVMMDGEATYYSKSVSITVKKPYVTTGANLTHYFGNGGLVHIPDSLCITEISSYAFSNYDFIMKDPSEITVEDPEYTKQCFIGDDTVEEVIIPEGVKKIGRYAFANLTALKKVTLPSTLELIDMGAFYGCTSLTEVVGMEHVKFINQKAFEKCDLKGTLNLKNAVAVADYAFASNAKLQTVELSESTVSLGAYAFSGDKALKTVTVRKDKIKIGEGVFSGCAALTDISVNTAVIPARAFDGCYSLKNFTVGKDVTVVGEYAFRGTRIEEFSVAAGNLSFHSQSGKPYLLSADGTKLLLVAPAAKGVFTAEGTGITSVADGAFSGVTRLTSVILPKVTEIGNHAFAGCTSLSSVTFGTLTSIGDYAFFETRLAATPSLEAVQRIGRYAFSESALESVTVPSGVTVGEGAFCNCKKLASVVIGDNAVLEKNAFLLDVSRNFKIVSYEKAGKTVYYYEFISPLHSLIIGKNVTVGESAFAGASELTAVTLGTGARLGNRAFYNNTKLASIDLSGVLSIGDEAFSSDYFYEYTNSACTKPLVENGYYVYHGYASVITEANLASLTHLGKSAFAGCSLLETVVLNGEIKDIPDYCFLKCVSLRDINLSEVETVGAGAFSESVFTSVDLSSAKNVGENAFWGCEKLISVTLSKNGTDIGAGSFEECKALKTVEHLGNTKTVGDRAFANTALASADLTGAVSVGDQAFAKKTAADFTVILGKDLKFLGENPFAMCRLTPFSSTVVESFHGKDFVKTVYSYDISDTVTVIDGSLYRKVPNGLVLVTYAGDADFFAVAEGTVRVSDMACAGTALVKVSLPSTVKAIGDKAFYQCNDLVLVTFASYEAPVLEEVFDPMYYADGKNIPATGKYELMDSNTGEAVIVDGIGVVPYFMWNAADTPSNVFYGATFGNYIGHITNSVVMVRPTNGRHYDSFIYGQYFATALDGAASADDVTLEAIAAINRIPETVRLSDKPVVLAARAAYDKISNLVQRSLVTNYVRLTKAEKRIKDLEFLDSGEGDPVPPAPTPEPTPDGISVHTVVYIILGVLLGASLTAAVVFAILYFKSNGRGKGPNPPKKQASEQASAEPDGSEKALPDSAAEDSPLPQSGDASAEPAETGTENFRKSGEAEKADPAGEAEKADPAGEAEKADPAGEAGEAGQSEEDSEEKK